MAEHAFFVFTHILFGKAGEAGDLGDHFPVVKRKTELHCQILANGVAAAAILPADGDDPVSLLHFCIDRHDVALHFGDGAIEKMDLAATEAGDVANEKRCDHCPFANAVELAGENEGEDDGNDGHGDVVDDLCEAEILMPGGGNGAHERFAGQHGNVGEGFQIDTKAENQAAGEQKEHFLDIDGEGDMLDEHGGEVDTITEDHTEWDLQRMLELEIAP